MPSECFVDKILHFKKRFQVKNYKKNIKNFKTCFCDYKNSKWINFDLISCQQ